MTGAGPATKVSRILIVEDDYLIATQIEEALSDAGFALAGVAASAEEATGLAVAERPDFVIMDIRLSGQRDGIDAALELFQRHGIRCIFATAHGDQDVRQRAQPARPFGWLQKPYSMASLVEAAREATRELSGERN